MQTFVSCIVWKKVPPKAERGYLRELWKAIEDAGWGGKRDGWLEREDALSALMWRATMLQGIHSQSMGTVVDPKHWLFQWVSKKTTMSEQKDHKEWAKRP